VQHGDVDVRHWIPDCLERGTNAPIPDEVKKYVEVGRKYFQEKAAELVVVGDPVVEMAQFSKAKEADILNGHYMKFENAKKLFRLLRRGRFVLPREPLSRYAVFAFFIKWLNRLSSKSAVISGTLKSSIQAFDTVFDYTGLVDGANLQDIGNVIWGDIQTAAGGFFVRRKNQNMPHDENLLVALQGMCTISCPVVQCSIFVPWCSHPTWLFLLKGIDTAHHMRTTLDLDDISELYPGETFMWATTDKYKYCTTS